MQRSAPLPLSSYSSAASERSGSMITTSSHMTLVMFCAIQEEKAKETAKGTVRILPEILFCKK